MTNRPASLIPLQTISPETYTDIEHGIWEQVPEREERDSSALLCARCQTFDFQSFARDASCRKGYLLSDIKLSAAEDCEFCSLLLEGVKDVAVPEYMESNVFWGKKRILPDIYVHMTLSKNYEDMKMKKSRDSSQANRILLEVGDRFSGVRNKSEVEICIAADPSSPAALYGDVRGRYLGNDPNSPEVYSTAREAFSKCIGLV